MIDHETRKTTNAQLLAALYARNRAMPNGGARLSVLPPSEEWELPHWTVFDGTHYVGEFASRQEAYTALKRAGFRSHKMCSEPTLWFHTY